MSTIQPEVLADVPLHAGFYSFKLKQTADARALCAQVNALYQVGNSLIGFGQGLLDALERQIPGYHGATDVDGPERISPAQQCDFWLRLSGEDPGQVALLERSWLEALSPYLDLLERTSGFKHREGRDLTGYVDGTENPEDRAVEVVSMEGEQGIAGSTMLAVQLWTHQLDKFHSHSQGDKDNIIGRRESDNEELDDAPISAHVKRTSPSQYQPKAYMLRRSLPWADAGRCGLYFVCFASSLYPFEAQLKRMLGCDDGVEDALFKFSHPQQTAYYWCPPVKDDKLDLSAVS